MKKADLKTDGTVYVAQQTGSIRQDERIPYNPERVVLLDLNSADAPRPRSYGYDREQRPIKARVTEGNRKGTEIFLSARRVLMTVEELELRKRQEEENKQRWAREKREALAKNGPIVKELNRLQVELGLLGWDDGPLIQYSLNQWGDIQAYDRHTRPEATLAALRRLKVKDDAEAA